MEFYLYVRRLGFCARWIEWMKACMESSRVFVLVNESPTCEFKLEKRLRQGNSLAPFFYLIMVECLAG